MRLLYAQELVLAAGLGLGFAHYRLTWPDRAATFGMGSWVGGFEVGLDSFFAGVGLVGGLGTFVERALGRSRVPWGPGRWVWSLVATYLVLTLLDQIRGTIAVRFNPDVVFIQNSTTTDIIEGLRGEFGNVLFPPATWFLLSFGLTSLVARAPRDPAPDAREWCGRAFAVLLISTGLVLTALPFFGVRPGGMGGGG